MPLCQNGSRHKIDIEKEVSVPIMSGLTTKPNLHVINLVLCHGFSKPVGPVGDLCLAQRHLVHLDIRKFDQVTNHNRKVIPLVDNSLPL